MKSICSKIAEILTVRFQSLSWLAWHCVSVTVVSRKVSSVPLVQIFFWMRIVGVVVVLLRMVRRLGMRLLRMMISLWWILRLTVVPGRDVSISSDHLAIRMLNVPERILNTAQISHSLGELSYTER